MILSPNQWRLLRDTFALAAFLESDPNMRSVAERLREAVGETIDLAEKLSEPEELTAPF